LVDFLLFGRWLANMWRHEDIYLFTTGEKWHEFQRHTTARSN